MPLRCGGTVMTVSGGGTADEDPARDAPRDAAGSAEPVPVTGEGSTTWHHDRSQRPCVHALPVRNGLLDFHADPQGRVFAAVTIAVLADLLVTLVLLVAAVEVRRTRPALGKGLAIGWAIGVMAMAAFAVLVLMHTSDWSNHCSCEPPIDFGQPW
jgi:hypothetical protein